MLGGLAFHLLRFSAYRGCDIKNFEFDFFVDKRLLKILINSNISFLYFTAESADVIEFGKSSKKLSDQNFIGRYGNGLKS